jgi:hypothetical protein
MIATVGSGLQPAAIRHCRRSSSCMFSVAPCSFHPGDVVADGAPVCEVRGRRPPLDPLLDQVAIASTMPRRQYSAGLPPLPMRPGRDRERGLGDSPFGVGHVRGVPGHPGTTADPAGAAPARHERRTWASAGSAGSLICTNRDRGTRAHLFPGNDTRRSVYISLTVCCPVISRQSQTPPRSTSKQGSQPRSTFALTHPNEPIFTRWIEA